MSNLVLTPWVCQEGPTFQTHTFLYTHNAKNVGPILVLAKEWGGEEKARDFGSWKFDCQWSYFCFATWLTNIKACPLLLLCHHISRWKKPNFMLRTCSLPQFSFFPAWLSSCCSDLGCVWGIFSKVDHHS